MSQDAPSKTTTLTVLMTPDMANFSGHVHGGAILRLLDQVAYVCAARYSGRYVVTVSVDQVTFRAPVHVGELVTFRASINFTGTTSMEIGARVEAESVRERTVRHVITCYFTMVAVDEERKPVPVPTWQPVTDEEKRRWNAALIRKDMRKEVALRFAQTRKPAAP